MKKILPLTVLFVLMLSCLAFGRIYGGTVLYQMTFHFSFKFLLPVIFGACCFFIVKFLFKDNITASVVTVIVFFAVFFFTCFPTLKVFSQYNSGNFIELSGTVKDFKTSDTDESFTLNGVVFDNYVHSGLGYDVTQSEGGVIKGDSQLLYIRYVEFMGRNVICYIENVM